MIIAQDGAPAHQKMAVKIPISGIERLDQTRRSAASTMMKPARIAKPAPVHRMA